LLKHTTHSQTQTHTFRQCARSHNSYLPLHI